MNKPRYRFFIILEFSALAILITSLAWLAQQKGEEFDFTPLVLAIPALASLLAIVGFLGAMHLRWLGNVDRSKTSTLHHILFWLLAGSFLSTWIIAIYKTFSSL